MFIFYFCIEPPYFNFFLLVSKIYTKNKKIKRKAQNAKREAQGAIRAKRKVLPFSASVQGTLSKMASFIVDSCRDQRFSLETWEWRRTIAWGRCKLLTIVDQFGKKISGFTPSFEALGRLLKKKKIMMTKIRKSCMSDLVCLDL